jgi:hypothetical protein
MWTETGWTEAGQVQTEPPVRTDPPYVPLRTRAWPQRRLPRWIYLAAAGLVLVAVAVGLVHKPSQGERASDLRGLLQQVTADIESCAGGVGESLTALHQVQSGAAGTPADISAGITVAQEGAANCSPANNELIDDLENYQVSESLYSFRLSAAVSALVDWAAPDAERVQTDVAGVLSARGAQARSQAQATPTAALTGLDAKRTQINAIIDKARTALAVTEPGPRLPG